jgi:hypothetical protein
MLQEWRQAHYVVQHVPPHGIFTVGGEPHSSRASIKERTPREPERHEGQDARPGWPGTAETAKHLLRAAQRELHLRSSFHRHQQPGRCKHQLQKPGRVKEGTLIRDPGYVFPIDSCIHSSPLRTSPIVLPVAGAVGSACRLNAPSPASMGHHRAAPAAAPRDLLVHPRRRRLLRAPALRRASGKD